jgi:hypothetical protein
MTTLAKRSVLQSLIEKPEAELPDWRLLCDLLRLDMASEASAARVVGILRAVSRSLAAGLWHESRPMSFAALSGSNIRDRRCRILAALRRPCSTVNFRHLRSPPASFPPHGVPPPGRIHGCSPPRYRRAEPCFSRSTRPSRPARSSAICKFSFPRLRNGLLAAVLVRLLIGSCIVEGEAHSERNLKMRGLAVFDVAARLQDFKPSQIP